MNSDTIINAALALDATGGGIIDLHPIIYDIDKTINLKVNNIHIRGNGATLKKSKNTGGPVIRLYLGTGNSISNLTIDCTGYDGRGIYLKDRYSWIEHVYVKNCAARPFGMNGGSNTTWGLDSEGRSDEHPNFTTISFLPIGCKIENCRVKNSGRTAYSSKQMRASRIINNSATNVYSEAATADGSSNHMIIAHNHFLNIGKKNGGSAFPNADGGFHTVGGGGVGGCGIDNSHYVTVAHNSFINIEGKAINIIDNIGPSSNIRIDQNHIINEFM